MSGEDRPLQSGDWIRGFLRAWGTDDAAARGGAEDLVRQIAELYGSALRSVGFPERSKYFWKSCIARGSSMKPHWRR